MEPTKKNILMEPTKKKLTLFLQGLSGNSVFLSDQG